MDFLTDIVLNPVILSCILAMIVAQLAKIALDYVKKRKIDYSLFLSTGGMPSGHSSVVAALVTSVYLAEGASSLFAVAIVIAFIVIYDSMTIRKTVGHHSNILNDILRALKLHQKYVLKELAGHSFTQVVIGLLLGFVVALLVNMI